MAYYYENVYIGEIVCVTEDVVDAAGGPDVYFDRAFVRHWWYQVDPDPRLIPAEEGLFDD